MAQQAEIQSGRDVITVDNSKSIEIHGDYFLYAKNSTLADDEILVSKNSEVRAVTGDFLYTPAPLLSVGNDQITIKNSIIRKSIYADDVDYSNDTGMRVFGNDTVTLQDATIEGSVYLSGGNDTITLVGNNNQAVKIWGGDENGANEEGYINQLNFSNYIGNIINPKIPETEGFEYFGLIEHSNLDLGDYYETVDPYERYIIDVTSTLTMTGGGTGNYTINGNLYNAGRLDFIDDKVGDKLRVTGDYIDASGQSYLAVDADLSTLTSDQLIVDGELKTAQTSIKIRDKLTAAAGTFGNITLIKATNDSNRSDEKFVFTPTNQYNNNPTAARLSSSPFI